MLKVNVVLLCLIQATVKERNHNAPMLKCAKMHMLLF